MKAFSGIQAYPGDTLLAERARDYLAGGPADPATLVRDVCQQPATPPRLAEQMAEAMLGGRPEFARCADGRWRLADAPDPSASSMPAPDPAPAPAPAPAGIPTFDEWLAARTSRPAAAVAERAPEPARRPRRPR
ncbi:MAG: hypothetical protein ACJ79S_16195, partial [Gemmatimonadaceae bacterium]